MTEEATQNGPRAQGSHTQGGRIKTIDELRRGALSCQPSRIYHSLFVIFANVLFYVSARRAIFNTGSWMMLIGRDVLRNMQKTFCHNSFTLHLTTALMFDYRHSMTLEIRMYVRQLSVRHIIVRVSVKKQVPRRLLARRQSYRRTEAVKCRRMECRRRKAAVVHRSGNGSCCYRGTWESRARVGTEPDQSHRTEQVPTEVGLRRQRTEFRAANSKSRYQEVRMRSVSLIID